ncbi:MAG: cell division protein ZapB [Magnetococcales bacterium]|nr:cell division protein ZapB [Magnetococcales bacterium]
MDGHGEWHPQQHDGQQNPAAADPLAQLEQRWEALAGTIQSLRSENAELREQLLQRDQRTATQDGELTRLGRQVEELQQEKARIVERIEGLLARFNE